MCQPVTASLYSWKAGTARTSAAPTDMQIFIKNIKDRKTFPIEITADDRVEEVKLAIEAAQGVAPGTQRLVFGGKTLKGGVPMR